MMRGEDGVLRLLDLGVALSGREPESARALHAGSPSYMNPEQWGFSSSGGEGNEELPDDARKLVNTMMEWRQLSKLRSTYTVEPPQDAARTVAVSWPNPTLPYSVMAFKGPAFSSRDKPSPTIASRRSLSRPPGIRFRPEITRKFAGQAIAARLTGSVHEVSSSSSVMSTTRPRTSRYRSGSAGS